MCILKILGFKIGDGVTICGQKLDQRLGMHRMESPGGAIIGGLWSHCGHIRLSAGLGLLLILLLLLC